MSVAGSSYKSIFCVCVWLETTGHFFSRVAVNKVANILACKKKIIQKHNQKTLLQACVQPKVTHLEAVSQV